ncbi:MAG: hypothetical protein R3F43_23855 [bacterium]
MAHLSAVWTPASRGGIVGAMHTPPDGRPLAGPEDFLRRIDQAVPLNFCVVAEVEGPLTDRALRVGLKALQARHPLLRVGFSTEPVPAFVPLDQPLPFDVCVQPEPAWTGAIVDELKRRFGEGPLAHLLWIRHGDARSRVVLTFHHAINDGHGGMYALRDLLSAAAAELAGQAVAATSLPLPPPITARIPRRIKGLRAISRSSPSPLRDLGRLIRQGSAGASCPRPLRCRQPDAACGGAHPGRGEHPAAWKAGAAGGRRPSMAPCSRRSGRRWQPERGRPVTPGARLTSGSAAAPAGPPSRRWGSSSAWSPRPAASSGRRALGLARRLRADVKSDADRGLAVLFHGLMGWLDRWWRRGGADARTVARRLYHFVPACAGITNLGRLSLPDRYGPLAVRSQMFFVHPSALGDLVGTAASFGGALHLNLSAMAPAVSPPRAQALADAMVARLQAACEDP